MSTVKIKNLSPGPRDYPMTSGESLYLPAKIKGVAWPVIDEALVSGTMRTAERKGAISISIVNDSEPANEPHSFGGVE